MCYVGMPGGRGRGRGGGGGVVRWGTEGTESGEGRYGIVRLVVELKACSGRMNITVIQHTTH